VIRLVIVGLTALGVFGGVAYWQLMALPHPSEATPTQLGYWLVLRDMSEQPEEIQLALIQRLVEDPTIFSTSNDDSVRLTNGQEKQLRSNIDLLKYTWFQDRVTQFQKTDPEHRWQFLEKQIDVVGDWATLMFENSAVLYPDAPADQDFSKLFFDEVESWLAKTPPDRHPQAYEAVADGIVCWLGTSSLTEQPDGTRLELANRVTRELDLGVEIDSSFDNIPKECHTQLAANCELMVEAWLVDTAKEYVSLKSSSEKANFVDQLIAKFEKWKVMELLGSFENAGETQNGAQQKQEIGESFQKFNAMIDTWVKRSEKSDAEALKKLVSAVKTRMLFKMLGKSSQSS
jgi:hypothetical protein